jgi:hypothetical protein
MKKVIFVIIALLCVSGILADGAKYLIIAPDSFVQAIQPLADWKTKKGVKAMVVPLSVTGNTALQIKNYILNGYNNWEIRPEYILLAGLGTVVPYSGSSNSDDYFADMTGNYQIELSIGRFPCATINQCQSIVAKTLSYERTPFMDDTTWYLKGTTIVREDGFPPNDSIWWRNVRYIHNFWRNYNYIQIDSLSRLRGNNSTDIMNSINNGRSFVAYQGTGITNWWSPFQFEPYNTNNDYKLPVVISSSDASLSLQGNDYLGDRFLNAGSIVNLKGAVAYFGISVVASGYDLELNRGTVEKGFFKAIFEDGTFCVGDVAKRAKYIIDSTQPPHYTTTRYFEWNLFGDPELNLWTAVPVPLTVTYDSIIHPTPCSVTVTVLSNGIAVRNALICLMKDTTIYEYGNTDSNGIKIFSISSQDTGTISITVTARNCHPFEGVIRVLPEGVEERSTLNATGSIIEIYPNPFRNQVTIHIANSINSQLLIYDVTGKLIMSFTNSQPLTTNNCFIWNGKDEHNRMVPANIYFAVVKTSKNSIATPIIYLGK